MKLLYNLLLLNFKNNICCRYLSMSALHSVAAAQVSNAWTYSLDGHLDVLYFKQSGNISLYDYHFIHAQLLWR